MAQWYAQVGGQRYGPVSDEEIRAWYAQGRVKPADYVWSEGMANWAQAGGVFGAPQTPIGGRHAGAERRVAGTGYTPPPIPASYRRRTRDVLRQTAPRHARAGDGNPLARGLLHFRHRRLGDGQQRPPRDGGRNHGPLRRRQHQGRQDLRHHRHDTRNRRVVGAILLIAAAGFRQSSSF